MERQIIFDQDEQEGLMYDLERANSEGLMEDLRLRVVDPDTGNTYPVQLNEESMEQIIRALDLGVNVEPGDEQDLHLELSYVYNYGRVKEEARS